ncbi:MAG TPA: ectonucleotide pyrophosphatase/phosphodiesterase [Flavitalea sp.]|nr:ectonucleotide pyrophosphatase/phosphodiesterase [Flavitalea sp.]
MKSVFIKALLFLLIGAPAAHAQKAKHVVLITIDGLRPEFYLDQVWGMANLNIMKYAGAYALGVNSVFPSVTLPAHTSIVTGASPAKHSIYYNAPFSPQRTSDEWYWYFNAITSPTLWEAVRDAGMRTASVNWPTTVGAPIDYNVPVMKKPGVTQLEATIPYCTPKGLLDEIQREATGRLSNTDFSMQGDYIVQDQTMARIGAYLIREYKPNFISIHLSAVDHFEHSDGRDGNMVRRAVSGVDREIRTIVESIHRAGIADSTAIIITGDHGHVDINITIAPNVWLSKAGLIKDLKNGAWKAQFKTGGGSAFLHLKDPADSITLRKVREIIANLPHNEKSFFHVLEKEKLVQAGGDPHAALALSARKGFAFNASLTGQALQPTHGHLPDFREIQTGFIASGAGIQPGIIIKEMNLVDVAPTVAHLLGINFPSAEGQIIREIVK